MTAVVQIPLRQRQDRVKTQSRLQNVTDCKYYNTTYNTYIYIYKQHLTHTFILTLILIEKSGLMNIINRNADRDSVLH